MAAWGYIILLQIVRSIMQARNRYRYLDMLRESESGLTRVQEVMGLVRAQEVMGLVRAQEVMGLVRAQEVMGLVRAQEVMGQLNRENQYLSAGVAHLFNENTHLRKEIIQREKGHQSKTQP